MKKLAAILAVCAVISGGASVAFAKSAAGIAVGSDNNIRYTVHNMSNIGPAGRNVISNTEQQVCVFCHTPHNAKPSVPLWNKVLPTQAFNMYTSSSTLSPTAKKVKAPGPESMLCLSCHDGRTAINVLHNTSNPAAQAAGTDKEVDIGGGYGDWTGTIAVGTPLAAFSMTNGYGPALGKIGPSDSPNISDTTYGGNLTDDHPISFSYQTVQGEDSKLQTVAYAEAKGIRFFGGDKRLECSSCHNPHVAYGWIVDKASGVGDLTLKPFLVRDNIGSALCLACHNK